jgi:parallel beta-helix repeat protein
MRGWVRLLGLALLAVALPCTAAIRYVDPAKPGAQDSGEGDAARPYRTLAYAMKRLQSGDSLNIAPGTYRESLIFPEIEWTGAPTSIQPTVKGGEVLIKGSDVVTGWERVRDGLFVKRQWTVNSQQVFVDGSPLTQVGGTILGGYPDKSDHPMKKLQLGPGGIWPGRVRGGVSDMAENSFYYDAGAKSLYVKLARGQTLEGRTVEVSVRPYLAIGKRLKGINLTNLRFQHANTTSVSYSGAISLDGSSMVLEGVDVSQVDGTGIDVTGDENVIRNSRADYCGQLGIKMRGRSNKLIDSEASFNNTRGFNKWWEAGGAKFVGNGGLRDSEVRGLRAIGNNGDGIWFDWMNSNNKVHENVSAYNAGFGIQYEASQKGYIYNNFVYSNKLRGIYLPHSSGSVVAHNLVAKNGMEGIAIIDEGRNPEKSEIRPRGNQLVGNIVAWNGKNAVVLPAGGMENSSDYNLYLVSGEPASFSLGWASRESPVRKGLEAWREASGQDAHSWSQSFAIPPDVLAALEKKQPDVNWSEILKVASRYSVLSTDRPAVKSAPIPQVQLTPGPKP